MIESAYRTVVIVEASLTKHSEESSIVVDTAITSIRQSAAFGSSGNGVLITAATATHSLFGTGLATLISTTESCNK